MWSTGKGNVRNSVQATTNAIPILTTANGKTVRNESEKTKIFQITEVSPGFSFCLFSVWLHQTVTYPYLWLFLHTNTHIHTAAS